MVLSTGEPPRRESGPAREVGVWVVATLAALLAGALMVLGGWGALSSTGEGSPAATEVPPAAGAEPGARAPGSTQRTAEPSASMPVFQPRAGQCLLLHEDPASPSVQDVPCQEAHHLEVVGVVDPTGVVSGEPTQQEWAALLETRCDELAEAHLGRLWDPYGQFRLRMAAPTPSEWRRGDRLGECLAGLRPDADGVLARFVGQLVELEQAVRYQPGACLVTGALVGAPPQPVPCASGHQLEVVESLDLSGRFEHLPDQRQWDLLDEECAAVLAARMGPSPDVAVVATVVRVPARSWLAGSRHSGCLAASIDTDTGQLAERTGSLLG